MRAPRTPSEGAQQPGEPQCHTAACERFLVDDSRSRRFRSSACAGRTTVAAHRARRRATG
ncbi:CGNR zinc finger domain-containing protein [Streptomyces sp. NPDC059467]|uniref:CGNR zinc finger domain-containing protein n=1 Tax=Streptomyces sp. NPDC059467 TaxID=3346844 RepID=UPI00369269FF